MKRVSFKTKAKKAYPMKKRGYQPPKWLEKIRHNSGNHGSTPLQKKAWVVVSRYVRMRDFKKYGGRCVTYEICGNVLPSWDAGQAAHFIAWTKCNGLFKYDVDNIALSCAACNGQMADKNPVGAAFERELVRRCGDGIVEMMKLYNDHYRLSQIDAQELVELIKTYLPETYPEIEYEGKMAL